VKIYPFYLLLDVPEVLTPLSPYIPACLAKTFASWGRDKALNKDNLTLNENLP
jgi:hypothetical protein